VVRDDGSSDSTLDILSDYSAGQPEKFHLRISDNANLGAKGSFSYLIEYVLENKRKLGMEHAYMMFCDQDDVWYDSKIETQVAAMLEAEKGNRLTPVLIHSDLQVVSENNEVIAESLIHFQGLEIERNQFPCLVTSNLVTGCTALINESLAAKSVPVAEHAVMHDWWLAMVASAFGKLIFLDKPLVHYRQHDANTIGARELIKPKRFSRLYWKYILRLTPDQHLLEVGIQATEFRRRFGQQLALRENLGLRITACMRIRIGILQRACYWLLRRF
jgi:glycosyltransferase involved in cell wall biosynthesis